MQEDYLVLEWNCIENNLSDVELEMFYDLINKITCQEPERKYLVLDEFKPYVVCNPEVANTKEIKLTKEDLLSQLNELSELGDIEMAHAEADELLLNYIDDREIESAFDKIEKWYS